MQTVKKYALNGIGQAVEFGKNGLILNAQNSYFELFLNDASTSAKVRVGAGEHVNDAVNLGQLNLKLDADKVVTDINATAGNIPDAPTVLAAINAQVAALVDSSPSTLDTLQELAAALGNDENFATTISNQIGAIAQRATDLETLSGMAQGSTGLGTFDEGVIPADSNIKQALQVLETGLNGLASASVLICGEAPVNFDSVSPVNVGMPLPADKHIKRVYVKVTQAYDDANAQLTLGTSTTPDWLVKSEWVDLGTVGVYEIVPLEDTTETTQMIATLSAGTSTQGSAMVYVEVC